jgi:hypothetical protein
MPTHTTEESREAVLTGTGMGVPPPMSIYKCSKAYLKGSAAWFLGTKYYSEGLQFESAAATTGYLNLNFYGASRVNF